jgi:hypothetical protein
MPAVSAFTNGRIEINVVSMNLPSKLTGNSRRHSAWVAKSP